METNYAVVSFHSGLDSPLLIIVTFIIGMVIGYLFNALSNLRLRGKLMSSNRKLKKAELGT